VLLHPTLATVTSTGPSAICVKNGHGEPPGWLCARYGAAATGAPSRQQGGGRCCPAPSAAGRGWEPCWQPATDDLLELRAAGSLHLPRSCSSTASLGDAGVTNEPSLPPPSSSPQQPPSSGATPRRNGSQACWPERRLPPCRSPLASGARPLQSLQAGEPQAFGSGGPWRADAGAGGRRPSAVPADPTRLPLVVGWRWPPPLVRGRSSMP